MTDNEVRILVRDILNDFYKEEELELEFDLEKCENCQEYELSEDLHDTAYGNVCDSCLNDIDY